jgi:hypothetical protein
MLRLIAVLFLALAPAAPACAETADEAAIRAAVFDYFHGQGEASAERLNRAFIADKATMIAVLPAEGGGETVTTYADMTQVLANWASNPNPPGGARDGEILDMHITDGRIATVMFRSTDRFYDALILAKVDGEWRIISKAFVRQQVSS